MSRIMLHLLFLTALSLGCLEVKAQENRAFPNCVVGSNYLIMLNGEMIKAVEILSGVHYSVPRRCIDTKVVCIENDGLFAFFNKSEPPLFVDFRLNKQIELSTFEMNHHTCLLVLEDANDIYLLSREKTKVLGTEIAGQKQRMHRCNLAVFTKKSIADSIRSGKEIVAVRNYAANNLPMDLIGGRVTDGEVELFFLTVDLSSMNYLLKAFKLNEEVFSLTVENNLKFGPLDGPMP